MSTGRIRVVMTGIGVVCPLGIGREEMWASVRAGRSGAGLITLFDTTDSEVRRERAKRTLSPQGG